MGAYTTRGKQDQDRRGRGSFSGTCRYIEKGSNAVRSRLLAAGAAQLLGRRGQYAGHMVLSRFPRLSFFFDHESEKINNLVSHPRCLSIVS